MKRQTPILKWLMAVGPLVVIAGAVGLWRQQAEIDEIDKRSEWLRDAIAARTGASYKDQHGGFSSKDSVKNIPLSLKIDWKKPSGILAIANWSTARSDQFLQAAELRAYVAQMNREEVVNAFADLDTANISPEIREELEILLFDRACKVAPDMVVVRFGSRACKGGFSEIGRISTCMQRWVEQDPVAAAAWFDCELAKGTFDARGLDGIPYSRVLFEEPVLASLISSNVEELGRRLDAIPENIRAASLNRLSTSNLTQTQQVVFAEIVRKHITTDEQARLIGRQVESLSSRGTLELSVVEDYMNRIEASQLERVTIAKQGTKLRFQGLSRQTPVTYAEIESLVEWCGRQLGSESADEVVSEAFVGMLRNDDRESWKHAAEMALRYMDEGGGEKALYGLFKAPRNRGYEKMFQPLLERIQDETFKERIKTIYRTQ